MRHRRTWVVVIHDIGLGDSEPATFGPYTQPNAERIAAAFNRTHENLGWWAGAFALAAPTVTYLRAVYEPNVIEGPLVGV